MSTAVEKPEEIKWAISERGKKLQVTQKEVDDALKLLAANGGKITLTAEQLEEAGAQVNYNQLRHWSKVSFPHRYLQLRAELQAEIGENVAGRLMERALQADEAQQKYIDEAVNKLSEVPAEHLAKNVASLSTAKSQDIQMSQLLRDRPTEIKRIDVNAAISVLEKLGVVEKPPADYEGEAEEIS